MEDRCQTLGCDSEWKYEVNEVMNRHLARMRLCGSCFHVVEANLDGHTLLCYHNYQTEVLQARQQRDLDVTIHNAKVHHSRQMRHLLRQQWLQCQLLMHMEQNAKYDRPSQYQSIPVDLGKPGDN